MKTTKKIPLQAKTDGDHKTTTFTMDKDTQNGLDILQMFTRDLLNLDCSKAVLMRRALMVYKLRIAQTLIEIGQQDSERCLELMAKFAEKERRNLYIAAGKEID